MSMRHLYQSSVDASNEYEQQQWTCCACTFLNTNPLYLSCEMCGKARLSSYIRNASERYRVDEQDWGDRPMTSQQIDEMACSPVTNIERHEQHPTASPSSSAATGASTRHERLIDAQCTLREPMRPNYLQTQERGRCVEPVRSRRGRHSNDPESRERGTDVVAPAPVSEISVPLCHDNGDDDRSVVSGITMARLSGTGLSFIRQDGFDNHNNVSPDTTMTRIPQQEIVVAPIFVPDRRRPEPACYSTIESTDGNADESKPKRKNRPFLNFGRSRNMPKNTKR